MDERWKFDPETISSLAVRPLDSQNPQSAGTSTSTMVTKKVKYCLNHPPNQITTVHNFFTHHMGVLFLHVSLAISQANKERMYPKAHVFLENHPSGTEWSNNLMKGSSEKTQDSRVCGHYLDKRSISFKAILN